jgi:GT2 family glycosyltransferase
MTPTVTAVIVAYADDPAELRDSVEALHTQTVAPAEVLLVDNHPDAPTAEAFAAWGVEATAIRSGANIGYAPGCNLAAGQAAGEWLFFLNPDAHAETDCIERLLEAADERTAIVGAQVLLPDGRTNAGDNPLHLTGLSWAGRYLEPREDGPPRDVAVASGAGLLVRRAAFEQLGGYHPSYFLYHDDVDLAWRARLAGWRVRFCPAAVVRHDYEFAKGTYKWFWLERNRSWTVLSNYGGATLLALAPLLIASEAGFAVVAWRGGWLREKLRAWWALGRELPELRRWRARVQRARAVPDSELLESFTGEVRTPLVDSAALAPANPWMERYRRATIALLRAAGR